MKNAFGRTLCIVFLAGLIGFAGSVFGNDPVVGVKAPGFTLTSFEGKNVSLSDYKGKIVVLEWFSDACPFVKYHYDKKTTMIDLANKYKGRGVVWLAINSTNHATDKQNKDFIKKHNPPYPILDDRSGAVGRAYNAKTTPHIYIISGEGTIVYNGGIDNSPMGKEKGDAVNYVDDVLASLTGVDGRPVAAFATKPYGCNVKYRKAPGFNLKSFDGKQVNLADLEGKIVVLEWFSEECPFVKYHYEKTDTMTALAKKYNDKNVVWLAINSTSHANDRQSAEYAAAHGVSHAILDDRSGSVGRAYRAKTTPHVFIIDAKGNVVYDGAVDNSPLGKKAEGVESVNYVDQTLSELLAGKNVSVPATKPYGCNVKYPRKPKAEADKEPSRRRASGGPNVY